MALLTFSFKNGFHLISGLFWNNADFEFGSLDMNNQNKIHTLI